MTDKLDARFGRCEYHIVYDTHKHSFNAYENNLKFTNEPAGLAVARVVTGLEIEAVIALQIGTKALEILKKESVRIFRAYDYMSVGEAIEAFLESRLQQVMTIPLNTNYHLQYKN